jgi:hypothetical protein
MDALIQIFDSKSINGIEWRQSESAQRARRYLVPLIESSPEHFVDNAHVQMLALVADSAVLPIVVSNTEARNCDVCSPFTHLIDYPLGEIARKSRRSLAQPLLLAAARLFRATQIDQVVYANNWLFTTNPSPHLASEQITSITSFLIQWFSDRAIVFPSVNKLTDPVSFSALNSNGYKMVPSRIVYLRAPSESVSKSDDVRRDERLVQSSPYRIITNDEITGDDVARITQLFRTLYLDKYTPLNPQFNERFFALVIKENVMPFLALKKDRIDAFSAYYVDNQIVTASLIGYDTSLPIEFGLYRQAMALFVRFAEEQGQVLNLSAGAGSFKSLRGGVPCVEYFAVFDRHLPYYRRAGWDAALASGLFQHWKAWSWKHSKPSHAQRAASLSPT